MRRALLIVAAGGLGLCLVLLTMATAFNGGSLNFTHVGRYWSGDTDFSLANGEKPVAETATSKSWAFDGDEIEIRLPANIHYQPGGKPMINVTAAPDVIKNVAYSDGAIAWSRKPLFGPEGQVDVTITGMALHKITVAGSGKIDLGQVRQDRLAVAIRGSGTVEGAGAVDDLDLAIAGSGRMRLGGLVAKKLSVSIAGSGTIDTAASDSADVSIAGSGTVRFHVKPKSVSSHIAGSGNIVDAVDEDTGKDSDEMKSQHGI